MKQRIQANRKRTRIKDIVKIKPKTLPINRRGHNIPFIKRNASDLQLMALESMNLLTSVQVPDIDQSVHAARHNPTNRKLRIRGNPRQRSHEARVPQQNLGTHELAVSVQRPQPNRAVPRRRRYGLAAANAYSANLNSTHQCKLKLKWKKGETTVFEFWKFEDFT